MNEYGAVKSSRILDPSLHNSTRTTPLLSEALALIITADPLTKLLLEGEVIEVTGAVVSGMMEGVGDGVTEGDGDGVGVGLGTGNPAKLNGFTIGSPMMSIRPGA
mgnify:CR=1 FL=1